MPRTELVLTVFQNQVYSLAATFIVGGSSPVELPFKPFPALALHGSGQYYEFVALDRSLVTHLLTVLQSRKILRHV